MIYLDKYAASSKLRDISPLAKFLMFIFSMSFVLIVKNVIVLLSFAACSFAIALYISNNGRKAIFKYALILIFFVALSTLPLLFERGGRISDFSTLLKCPLGFQVNNGSLQKFLYVSARCLSSSLLVLLLILIMPISQILYIMKRARIPILFIEITELIYRNIFLLIDTAEKILISQKSRLAYNGFSNKYKHFAILVSQVFKLSFLRADDQYNGLLSRCYDEEQPTVFYSSGMHNSSKETVKSNRNTNSDIMNIKPVETVISLKNISYTYPDGTEGLKDISLDIKTPEKIVILGKNGSGKSTLFLCLNGILKPKTGEYVFNNKKIEFSRKDLFKLRKEVALVFQDSNNQLFAPTVYEELAFGMSNLKYSKEEIKTTIDNLVDRFGLSVALDKVPHLLSEGQKKWLCIASLVATDPSVIILDEPTSNLDSKHTELVMKEMDNLYKSGKTVVISTHDVNLAYEWADRIIVVDDGRIIKDADPLTVFSDASCLEKLAMRKPFLLEMYDKLGNLGSDNQPRTMDDMLSLIKLNKN
ncbi:MAG: ATP-binding cassette domain-containing protein [Marinifilaceae bacterium]